MDSYDSGIQPEDEKCKQFVERKELQETLCHYTSDNLGHIATVSEFCLSSSEWRSEMKANITKLKDIKEKEDRIDLSFGSVSFVEWLWNKLIPQNILDGRREELEKELAGVFKDIIGGLEKLKKFADAVETLAVTSLHVFVENNQVLQLPEGMSLKSVQAVITAAIQACPLLLQVKREARTFFTPSLHNVEVHSAYLDQYIIITQMICDMMAKGSVREFEKMKNTKTLVQLPADLAEGDIQDMLHLIEYLTDIRNDQHLRAEFLFQCVSPSGFIKKFSERETRMLQFLTELEEAAVQLDRMKKGAQISTVTGSSVGVVSGVLGIVGLALTPVTAGASLVPSLVLIATGTGLGVASAVNGIVTTGTEIGVNTTQQKKADNLFNKFKEDVKVLQVCLEEVSNKALEQDTATVVQAAWNIGKGTGCAIGGIVSIVDDSADLKALHSGMVLLSGVSEVPESGQAAKVAQGTFKGLSNTWRAGLIGLNALFLGWNMMSIVTGSMSLAKGSKSEISLFIRARASLFSSELDSWKKIHDALSEGMATSGKKKTKLEQPFYPS